MLGIIFMLPPVFTWYYSFSLLSFDPLSPSTTDLDQIHGNKDLVVALLSMPMLKAVWNARN